MERKHYLDNLRWIVILLLFPFHAAQIWNGGEYSGFYIWSHTNNILYAFSTAIYPWFMTLLFAIAGMSCKYALQKRTSKQFILERVRKLLIPFMFGVLLLVPVMTYTAEIFFHGYTGTYLEQYALFFMKESDLTGYKGGFTPGHLWFLIYLLVISFVSLPIISFQKKRSQNLHTSKLSYFMIIFLFIPEWLMLYVLNIGGKSIGQFLFLFLIGYFILSDRSILGKLMHYRFVSLALFLVSGALYTYLYCFANFRNEIGTGLYVFYGWMGILTFIGMGQTRLNFNNTASTYLVQASFPIYIIHQPVLVVVGFFLLKQPIGLSLQFVLIVIISFSVTFLLYEIVKRIPFVSVLFGIDRLRK